MKDEQMIKMNTINEFLKNIYKDEIKSKEQIEKEKLEKEKQELYKKFRLDGEE